jgi:spermidine/putrescine transport system permease protein
MTTATAARQHQPLVAGIHPLLRVAAFAFLVHALGWAFLFCRWLTFGSINWTPLALELYLAQWSPLLAYTLFGALFLVDLVVAVGLLREMEPVRWLGVGRAVLVVVAGVAYYLTTRQFYEAAVLVGVAGLLLALLSRHTLAVLIYPSGFWLALFFLVPLVIVFIVSLGQRDRLGTVAYPAFDLTNLAIYFDDYARFFSAINGEYIYLRIFGRSLGLAILNTLICLLFGYPFAFWIARQPERYRGFLIFLVMIPFWTNFLVRTYAWMLILRDSGLINNLWTITLHQQAVMLADKSSLFAWLATATAQKLPLLFNQPAVLLGLFYGFLPFMVLPLYANLEKMDWSLLEAAADLGAGNWQIISRILLPLTAPGIAAGSIIVFIPSLGAYVTPDLMGGGRVSLVGNLLQQQFLTVRNWPFGAAIGFILMSIMLLMTIIYFRIVAQSEKQ